MKANQNLQIYFCEIRREFFLLSRSESQKKSNLRIRRDRESASNVLYHGFFESSDHSLKSHSQISQNSHSSSIELSKKTVSSCDCDSQEATNNSNKSKRHNNDLNEGSSKDNLLQWETNQCPSTTMRNSFPNGSEIDRNSEFSSSIGEHFCSSSETSCDCPEPYDISDLFKVDNCIMQRTKGDQSNWILWYY